MRHPLPCLFLLGGVAATLFGEITLQQPPMQKEPQEQHAPSTSKTAGNPETEKAHVPGTILRDVLYLLNHDTLHGNLISIDPQSGIRWQHHATKTAIQFNPAHVAKIALHPRKISNLPPSGHAKEEISRQQQMHSATIRLANQDSLKGKVVSLDAERLIFDTWYAGQMIVQRNMVQSIVFPSQHASPRLYEGPTGLEGWKVAEGDESWKYSKGTFLCTGGSSIGRDFKLPDMSSIELDVVWSDYLHFAVFLYTDSLDDEGGNAYQLELNEEYAFLYRSTQNGDTEELGETRILDLQQKNKFRLGIWINRKQRTISLLINDFLIKQWKDHLPFAGKGTGIMFYPKSGSLMKLSGIRISEWDGRIENPFAPTTQNKDDIVNLVNGDHLAGRLRTVLGDKVAFATSYGTLEIPLSNVREIMLAGEKTERAGPNANEVRAFFPDGCSVTFQLESWNEQWTAGASPGFGKLKFVSAAFSALHFNPDQTPKAEGEIEFEIKPNREHPPPSPWN